MFFLYSPFHNNFPKVCVASRVKYLKPAVRFVMLRNLYAQIGMM